MSLPLGLEDRGKGSSKAIKTRVLVPSNCSLPGLQNSLVGSLCFSELGKPLPCLFAYGDALTKGGGGKGYYAQARAGKGLPQTTPRNGIPLSLSSPSPSTQQSLELEKEPQELRLNPWTASYTGSCRSRSCHACIATLNTGGGGSQQGWGTTLFADWSPI